MYAVARSTIGAALAALALLAALPAAAAPTPEAAATKTFLSRQKAARNAFRAALKAADTEAGLALRAVEQGIAANGNLFAAGNDTFAALRDFQGAVQVALDDAADEQADAARDALAPLGPGLVGHFPEAFYPSDDQPPVDFQTAVESDLAKAYAKLRKRVARVGARFEAADFGFTFRIRPPKFFRQRSWNELGTVGNASFVPLIDLAVAWSSLATSGDGQLRVAGSSSVSPVEITASTGSDDAASDAITFENRFVTDFGGDGFVEGVWIVNFFAAEASDLSIGIR